MVRYDNIMLIIKYHHYNKELIAFFRIDMAKGCSIVKWWGRRSGFFEQGLQLLK